MQVQLYDTTLRDGVGRHGISFSLADKLKIVQKLNELGIHYIEGGWPGGIPKDTEFFQEVSRMRLSHSKMVAFGSTRHPHSKVEDDANLKALLDAATGVVTIVAKSWDLQATHVLEVTPEENLVIIEESIRFLKLNGRTVFMDAEHFFDGFKGNPDYAISAVRVAQEAGADCVVLCDTNGGSLAKDVFDAVEAVKQCVSIPLGIHAHNDTEMAVANSLAAVRAGAVQVQGTINGYGERCGNASLCSIIPNLQLKMGIACVTQEQLSKLTQVSRDVAELANLTMPTYLPYVGASAFTHKAGLHVSGMMKWEESYQHINPALVGNTPQVVVSEISGRKNIIFKAKELGVTLPPEGKEARQVLEQIKKMESKGFQYEGADASFELLLHRAQPEYASPFTLIDFMVVVEKHRRQSVSEVEGDMLSEATIKVRVGDTVMHTAAEGNGPVNALDQALRKALLEFYPTLIDVKLVDYKVRILEESSGTGSQVRVLIESTDGQKLWKTVGSSTNIIDASWLALADSLEYWLLKNPEKR